MALLFASPLLAWALPVTLGCVTLLHTRRSPFAGSALAATAAGAVATGILLLT